MWTFRDGETPYERLEGIDTEIADWHDKYTLYKSLFLIGTTSSSINRAGKTNASKGVESNFNEYSEFHAREIEAHILASFMEMTEMKDTSEAHKQEGRWKCRAEDCTATYVYHSGRVRHEIEVHNLSFDNGTDTRDAFGYFYCRARCGEVFKTKTTRNRHEENKHGQVAYEQNEEIPKGDDNKQDYCYNYHIAKLTFGLFLMDFSDAVKEGDGDRLFNIYKVALLLFKTHGHYKYAYVILLHLVKCISILPKQQALSCKWNKFYNGTGHIGRNVSLDYKKELQHSGLKAMWRQLGPNLNEASAERIAGTLETVDLIYESIDRDCVAGDKHGHRTSSKDEDAVKQIVEDLITCKAFMKIEGRKGYPSFPEFDKSLLHDLDYRDLHKWMQEHIALWGSIYQ
ncbi:uncharacterized protein [Montipora capricornis]|uniref:uncharacterized protein n=1 Tax=Montipora capricornis TaxID=246305 RepID=UPI0035F1B0DF